MNGESADLFGIAANVFETDRVFRSGAKLLLCGGTGGEGWHKFEWRGLSRSGRRIKKWAPTVRLHNFRAAWIPLHERGDCWYLTFAERAAAETCATEMSAFADELRLAHPNRRPSRQYAAL